MSYHYLKTRSSSASSQQGIATVLLVVLIGIGLVGTAFGVMHTVRSTQEKHVAAHASTHAQAGLWTGVEAFRRYIGSLATADLFALNGAADFRIRLTSNGVDDVTGFGALTVSGMTVTAVPGASRVSAVITNIHADAKSSASMEVQFRVNATGGVVQLPATLNFYDTVTLAGQVELDTSPNINVKGDINLASGVNITAINALNSTGNVSLHSQVSAQSIRANGNVTLDGSSTVLSVKARGDVTTVDNAGVGSVQANGNVTLGSSKATTSIDSLSSITARAWSGNHALLRSAGPIVIDVGFNKYNQYLEYSGTVAKAQSLAHVNIRSPGSTLSDISADTLTCPSAWEAYTSIKLRTGVATGCNKVRSAIQDAANTSAVAPTPIEVDVMAEVQPYSLPPLIVDVFQLRSMANYQIEYVDEKVKVIVQNINGVTDGEYFLGNYSASETDFLCKVVAGGDCVCQESQNGVCADPKIPLCLGGSNAWNTSCIHYAAGLFTFTGISTAPGIMWVDGNVRFENGFNNTTMLATGNISSNGQYRGAAVNYGYEPPVYFMGAGNRGTRTTPYQEICLAKGTGINNNTYTSMFSQRYPTNLCVNGAYQATPVGNIALAAGGVRPGGDDSYTGGDITIGSNSMVYGVTLAGGYLQSGGQTVFFGQVAAAVQGPLRADGSVKNVLGENTKVLVNSATDFYSPSGVPEMAAPPNPANGGVVAPNSNLIWSKYL